MVKLDLDQVVMRRMKEEDIEVVKALVKEGCEGTENRLILHILTRPLCLFVLAVFSSVLRCLVHSFVLSLAVPVFLPIVLLKLTVPRSTGVLGSSRPAWDYVGSSFRGAQEEAPGGRKPRRRAASQQKAGGVEAVSAERQRAAGEVWLAEVDDEVLGCVFREPQRREGVSRLCRLVIGCWHRRAGLARHIMSSMEERERQRHIRRIYAHVPFPSKGAEAFFRKTGYRQLGEEEKKEERRKWGREEEEEEKKEREEEELYLEGPERGVLGYPLTKVFYKDL